MLCNFAFFFKSTEKCPNVLIFVSLHSLQGDDDIVFETFHHKSGKEYTCIRQGGRRFYLDNWNTHVSIDP